NAAAINPDDAPSRHRADFLIAGKRLGDAAKEVEAGDSSRLRHPRDAAASNKRLDLRSHSDGPPIVGVVKRLDAVRITSQQHLASVRVPQCKGEHPAKL